MIQSYKCNHRDVRVCCLTTEKSMKNLKNFGPRKQWWKRTSLCPRYYVGSKTETSGISRIHMLRVNGNQFALL